MFIIEDWLSKLWSTHIMEYGAVVKKNEENRTDMKWCRYSLNGKKKRCKVVCVMLPFE